MHKFNGLKAQSQQGLAKGRIHVVNEDKMDKLLSKPHQLVIIQYYSLQVQYSPYSQLQTIIATRTQEYSKIIQIQKPCYKNFLIYLQHLKGSHLVELKITKSLQRKVHNPLILDNTDTQPYKKILLKKRQQKCLLVPLYKQAIALVYLL